MTPLQLRIQETINEQELESVLRSAEPRQCNGEMTSFVSHLQDALWYVDLDTLKKRQDFAIKICNWYSK